MQRADLGGRLTRSERLSRGTRKSTIRLDVPETPRRPRDRSTMDSTGRRLKHTSLSVVYFCVSYYKRVCFRGSVADVEWVEIGEDPKGFEPTLANSCVDLVRMSSVWVGRQCRSHTMASNASLLKLGNKVR